MQQLTASDAFDRVISVSVTIPISDNNIFAFTSSCLIFDIANLIASEEP